MKRLVLFLLSLLVVSAEARAQAVFYEVDRKHMATLHKSARANHIDPAQDHYDMKYVDMRLRLSDTSTYIEGDVTVRSVVTVPSMDRYVFELDEALTIDSAWVNGAMISVTTTPFKREISLASPLTQGSTCNVRIRYHGLSPQGVGFAGHGLTRTRVGQTSILYSLSDMYAAKDWWPAKQVITDKIDSARMHLEVPAPCRAGSNGVLDSVTAGPTIGMRTFHWTTHYPIDYYLLSLSVAQYGEYRYYAHLPGSSDSVQVINYIPDSTTFLTQHKREMDTVGRALEYFSTIYGRYPFWKEKYGNSFTDLPGGMEHQTMTTVGVTSPTVLAHELAHQWWGDAVTYSSWADVWLSEGWATYSEQLFTEHFVSPQAAAAIRNSNFTNIMSSTGGSVYVDDTSSFSRVFDSRLTYYKGAAVAHMLRYLAPSDSVFFAALRDYQSQFRYGLAATHDLQNVVESHYGFSVDTFLQEWIYGEGYPVYGARWGQAGTRINLMLTQSTSRPQVTPLFHLPVELRFIDAAAGRDTTIRVYNDRDTQRISFDWAYNAANLRIDPDNQIVNRISSVGYDAHLSDEILAESTLYSTNPSAGDAWQLMHAPEGSRLRLTDLSGRPCWSGVSRGDVTSVPGQQLSPGVYLLRVQLPSGETRQLKLVRS